MSKLPASATRLMGGPPIRTRPAMTLCQRLRPGIGLNLGMSGAPSGTPTPPPPSDGVILLESSGDILLEDGSLILLE